MDALGRRLAGRSALLDRWLTLAGRVIARMREDRADLVAAGLAFYAALSVVPATVAALSLYVVVTDIATVTRHLERITAAAPDEVQRLVVGQVIEISNQADGLVVAWFAVGLVLWSVGASRGTAALIRALNLVHGVPDERPAPRRRLLAIGVSAVVVITVAVGLGATELVAEATAATGWLPVVIRWGRWPVLLGLSVVALALAYRFGPEEDGRDGWPTRGTLVAASAWVVASAVLAGYLVVVGFASAFYGALGALLAVQLWAYALAAAVLVGAYVDVLGPGDASAGGQ